MNIRKWLKNEARFYRVKEGMKSDKNNYDRLTKNQVSFYDNDEHTQQLLNDYTRVISDKDSEPSDIARIAEQIKGKDNLWLYLQRKISQKMMGKSEGNIGGGENKG